METRPSLLLLLLLLVIPIFVNASSPFPAIVVFGDSLVDTGNNNYITTAFRANHAPYGRDFPDSVPTGRFSNGKLMVDFLAEHLEIKDTVPPALQPGLQDVDLRTGVNFASAGSGYDDRTSQGFVIPFSLQMENFKSYVNKLQQIAGPEEAQTILNNALVVISCGGNDFGIGYILGRRSIEFFSDIVAFQNFLLTKVQGFLTTMYQLGLRKIMVLGLPGGGCTPITSSILPVCIEVTNSGIGYFNMRLKNTLAQLQMTLPGSKLAYGNIFDIWNDMFKNPAKYGFQVSNRGCCGQFFLATGPMCTLATPLCFDANQYMFFDLIHPTEAAYRYMTQALIQETLPQLY